MPQCTLCSKEFIIYSEEKAYYLRLSVPEPKTCPSCRRQLRLAFRNERNLHYRQCDLCKKNMLSYYSSNVRFPVYCPDCWYEEKFQPLDFGREFDFDQPFFPQFHAMQNNVPRAGIAITRGTVENSDYVNAVTGVKNSYLIFNSTTVENSYYSHGLFDCTEIIDSSEIYNSEKCYDCLDCEESYNLIGCSDCRSCLDNIFCIDCTGCKNCFGCVNLRYKNFYFFNQELTEEEYKSKKAKINLQDYKIYQQYQDKFLKFAQSGSYKYYHGHSNEKSSGDYLWECSNVFQGFDSNQCENCRYITKMKEAKECQDVDYFGNNTELVYNSNNCGNYVFNLKFCTQVWDTCSNMEYCDYCLSGCKNCFGCVGLINQQNCIFNKKYSEADFIKLKEKIIQHMRKHGEYGEFFPGYISHLPYNETIAQDHYPLTRGQAIKQGFNWSDEERKKVKGEYDCQQCGKGFNTIKQEEDLLDNMKVPWPVNCFQCRIKNRLARKNKRDLYNRKCTKCQKNIQTTYEPNRPEKIYCEECFNMLTY